MTTEDLACTVTIGGTDFSSYVVRIEREHFICRPVGQAVISLNADDAPDCNPGDSVVISEMGRHTFKGYVSDASKERMPPSYEVSCQDELKRLVEYNFVDTAIPSSGQTITYWIEYFLSHVGITSYDVETTTKTVPSTLEFNVESPMDIVRKLCGAVGWQIYADAYGTVHVGDFFKLANAKSVLQPVTMSALRDDSWLRNRIVVFGSGTFVGVYDLSLALLGDETRAVVLASPGIDTLSEADEAAERMAEYFSTPLQTKEVTAANGAISLLDTLAAGAAMVGGFTGLVTGLESEFSRNGYRITAYLDERCPQFWGFWEDQSEIGNIWLSTEGQGVYRYVDYDDTWVAVNADLSGEALNVREVAVDRFDPEIAWTAALDGVRQWYLGVWTEQSLPTPANDAGDDPAPSTSDLDFVAIEVTEAGTVLATARHRSEWRGWLYSYDGSWANQQLSYGGSYAVKPLAGPQALHAPVEGILYLTAETASERGLMRRYGTTLWSTPYSTSGCPLEVAGPLGLANPIYLFGNSTPILLKSGDGGGTQTDIKHTAEDPVRPVLSKAYEPNDDLLVVASSGNAWHREVSTWTNQGAVPIAPECGLRGKQFPTKVLLGQKQAGETYKVAYSPDTGTSWSDLSTGLPDVKITSIDGGLGVGAGGWPVISVCPELEGFRGRYWWKRYCRHLWPEMWDYLQGGGVETTCYNWRTEVVSPTPHLGFMVTHVLVDNCEEHPVEDGFTFDLILYVYSPLGASSTASEHRLVHRQAQTKVAAEEPQYYGDANNDGQYGTWQTTAYSVTKLSGLWTNGWFKIVFQPWGGASEPDCLFTSSPWMAFSYVLRTGDVKPFKRATPTENWPDCDGYTCDSQNTQQDSILVGERSYPFDYLTLGQEFAARFPLYTLGGYAGYCVASDSYPFYSHVWVGQDEGLGLVTPWYKYEMYDFGMGLIHIVGE